MFDKHVLVAVGIVVNEAGKILVALRPEHAELGDLWEFPGGKIEQGETVEQALKRELQEEVGIIVHAAKPFMQIEHQYTNKIVLLDVWRVEKFSGEPKACEAQKMLQWISPKELMQLKFPAANYAIIHALLKKSV